MKISLFFKFCIFEEKIVLIFPIGIVHVAINYITFIYMSLSPLSTALTQFHPHFDLPHENPQKPAKTHKNPQKPTPKTSFELLPSSQIE